MSQKLLFSIVIHNHQPVGNFGHVFQEAADKAYLPFLRELIKHPSIKLGLHTSGCLWEWFDENLPEYEELVRALLDNGQLELLGGGMYEPILPVLRGSDAMRQMSQMSQYLEGKFGEIPKGMWCPERVWEPHLPELIASSGLHYTLLDDYHFRSVACENEVATSYFATDHAGALTYVLPINKQLRYSMPFQPVAKSIDYLKELHDNSFNQPIVIFGDDGEKFGNWPDTYDWVYINGWLKEFFGALEDNQEWLETIKPCEVLKRARPKAHVYLPTGSYMEMGEWTSKTGDSTSEPGIWRNYFARYPESYAMYERANHVSALLQKSYGMVEDISELKPAEHDLARAQCNCPYWHGVFGGIYLNYLRNGVSSHAIKAENAVLELNSEGFGTEYPLAPFSYRRRILRNESFNAIVNQNNGLYIERLELRKQAFCISDVLGRRKEAYHAKLLEDPSEDAQEHASIHDTVRMKEPGLADALVYDTYRRSNFVTWFLEEASYSSFSQDLKESSLKPKHLDCGIHVDTVSELDKSVSGILQGKRYAIRKSIDLSGGRLGLEVATDTGLLPDGCSKYVCEFNLTLLANQGDDRYLLINGERHNFVEPSRFESIQSFQLVDEWQGFHLPVEANVSFDLVHLPVYTVSSSEGGFEKTYQGSCYMLVFDSDRLKDKISVCLSLK